MCSIKQRGKVLIKKKKKSICVCVALSVELALPFTCLSLCVTPSICFDCISSFTESSHLFLKKNNETERETWKKKKERRKKADGRQMKDKIGKYLNCEKKKTKIETRASSNKRGKRQEKGTGKWSTPPLASAPGGQTYGLRCNTRPCAPRESTWTASAAATAQFAQATSTSTCSASTPG